MSTSTVAELLKDKANQSPDHRLFSVGPEVVVSEAVALMVKSGISSVLITESGEMLGLITLRELLKGLNTHGGALMQATCRNVMKVNPPVAKPDDTVDHLRGLMTELHITHVPVMDHGALVGILSFHDIARSAIKDVDFENKLLKQYIRNWPE
ncbi:MAG: CBS domain-containing protein [Betaproteobacteria bacterium]|nr:CBS domain-containing protein [Betaproteobacteria bacterium]